MCCYKTHAAQSNELVTEDVELDCWVLAHEPYCRLDYQPLPSREMKYSCPPTWQPKLLVAYILLNL